MRIEEHFDRMLPIVNVVKIGAGTLDDDALADLIKKLKRWPVLLLAEKVENRETAKKCIDLGFNLLQGFYFAKPEIITGKRVDP